MEAAEILKEELVEKKDMFVRQLQELRGTLPCRLHVDLGYPQRDQGRILPDWFRPLRTRCLPCLRSQVEDGKGNWRY